MAFMGILLFNIVLLVMGISVFLAFIFLVIAIVRKIRKKKRAWIPMVISIVCISPTVIIVVLLVVITMSSKVTLYDGSTVRISNRKIDRYYDLVSKDDLTSDDLKALDKLLTNNPNLIYYLSNNYDGLIDIGLSNGDYDLVKMALDHGAIFDDPRRYERKTMACSMGFYLGEIADNNRTITSEDVDILNCMFENNVITEIDLSSRLYSNYFGEACWMVLYNDERVTDTELEFINVFLDNGFYNDESFILYEDSPSNLYFGDNYHFDVIEDDNYYELVNLVMR